MHQFPTFIKATEANGYKYALILARIGEDRALYWRKAGYYRVEVHIIDGKMISKNNHVDALNGIEFEACFKSDFDESNRPYERDGIPFIIFDDEIDDEKGNDEDIPY